MGVNIISNANQNDIRKTMLEGSQKSNLSKSKSFDIIKDEDYYVNEIKKNIPGSVVCVKSMSSDDIDKYYEKWKKQPIALNAKIPEITISPKVLEKMKSDPEYEKKMMAQIEKESDLNNPEAAKLNIYEYKVFVDDNGEVQVMICADDKIDYKKVAADEEERKKEEKKKQLKKLQLKKYSSDKEKLKVVNEEKVEKNIVPSENYLYQNVMMINLRNQLK